MASTNKTTHYNLSQYVGSDKPTYLVDYNQDMSKIDTGIYEANAKAVVNATKIGDLTDLTTTDKLSLVNAINEVNSESTTIGDLTNLTTTDKSSVVGAVNEVNGKANTIGDLTDLTTSDKSEIVDAINEVNAKTNNIGNLSNLTTADKTSVVSAVNEVNSHVGNVANLVGGESNVVDAINNDSEKLAGVHGEIIWTNQNPTSSFAGQTITLSKDLDLGDCYEIIYRQSTTNKRYLSTGIIPDGHGCFMGISLSLPEYRATAENVSGTTITFTDAYQTESGGTYRTDNTLCIPVYVILYNKNLF